MVGEEKMTSDSKKFQIDPISEKNKNTKKINYSLESSKKYEKWLKNSLKNQKHGW